MKHFYSADILLPDFSKVDGTKWATVACDQFTGEPEYWHEAERIVGDAESTLNLMIPEAFLGESAERTEKISLYMEKYLNETLVLHKNAMIYVERTQSDGKVRKGLVGKVDLEDYDYNKGSFSPIRATEGTVLSRIPPRIAVRRNATIEMPHIMMLVNDKENTLFGSLSDSGDTAYDFPLMLGGGHIKGRFLSETDMEKVTVCLEKLALPDAKGASSLLFAIGDGNHSLAAAKAAYEEIKSELGDDAKNHPARYALVEVVNLYDEALIFEPIYRVVIGCDTNDVMKKFKKYASSLTEKSAVMGINNSEQTIECIYGNCRETVKIQFPVKNIPVATLQDFLDEYIKTANGAEIDYIHDESSLKALAERENSIGFIFEGIGKDGFFETIIKDGAFPRKTFSMGHARDKRYYLECRKIVK